MFTQMNTNSDSSNDDSLNNFANMVYDKLDEIVELIGAIEENHKKRIVSLEEEVQSLKTGMETISKVVEANGVSLAGLLEKNRFEFRKPTENDTATSCKNKKENSKNIPIKDSSTYYTVDLSYPQMVNKRSNHKTERQAVEEKINNDIEKLIKKLVSISI